MGADESGSAGDQNAHSETPFEKSRRDAPAASRYQFTVRVLARSRA